MSENIKINTLSSELKVTEESIISFLKSQGFDDIDEKSDIDSDMAEIIREHWK